MNNPAYIDLGLPSGTLWRSSNEEGLYTFDEAVKKFGNKLPSIKQIDELVKSCTQTYDRKSNSMRATGSNGDIFFSLWMGLSRVKELSMKNIFKVVIGHQKNGEMNMLNG